MQIDTKWFLSGIKSFISDCKNGGVYTRVSSYYDWIFDTLSRELGKYIKRI